MRLSNWKIINFPKHTDVESKIVGDPRDEHIVEEMADITICGKDMFSRLVLWISFLDMIPRFGSSFGVADLNFDSILDLVVGEPYTGYGDLTYGGVVKVFYGVLEAGEVLVRPIPGGAGKYGLEEGYSLVCTESPCGLGTTMEQGGGLVVAAAPFVGSGGNQRGATVVLGEFVGEVGAEYLVPGEEFPWFWLGGGSQVNILNLGIFFLFFLMLRIMKELECRCTGRRKTTHLM